MKVRNGFVSNSSSSSFVVAFPKKPKSVEDVHKMMFDGEDGRIQPYDFADGLSYSQIAKRVWDDIKTKPKDKWSHNKVPAKLTDIKDEFANRYYYSVNSNVSWGGRTNDEKGGSWYYPIGKYFGSDKTVLNELRDFIIDIEKRRSDIEEKQRIIFKTEFNLKCPPYANKGGKDSNGKKYTKKQISDYENYYKAVDRFKKEHVEYAALQVELEKIWKEEYGDGTQGILVDKIAGIDAKAFCDDHKGSFFVILSYTDENNESTLEHGEIFKNVPHVQISHH
jgi:hypothetical protein